VFAPVQAVIFDLDGTLVDREMSVTAALHAWLPTLGHAATEELVSAWFAAEGRHFPAWRAGQISHAEQRRRRLRDYLPMLDITPGNDASLDDVFAGFLRRYEASWTKFDDVDAVLLFLSRAGLKTAILSNGSVDQQNAKIAAVGLNGRVGPVFTADELGAAKPDPSSYLTVCTQLGVEPGHALHVGDLYDLDVVAARAAGLQALHLDRANRGPHEELQRITSLRQLQHQLTIT
jgi:putative hydrolase of the HAD superfamily